MVKIRKRQVTIVLLTTILLLSSGLFHVSATPPGNEAGDCDRDRLQDRTRDGDCDKNCICDGPGDCECNSYGPSDGDGGARFGYAGDCDPKLKVVRTQNRWQHQWEWIN